MKKTRFVFVCTLVTTQQPFGLIFLKIIPVGTGMEINHNYLPINFVKSVNSF